MPGSPSQTLKQTMPGLPKKHSRLSSQHLPCQHLKSNITVSWTEELYSLVSVCIGLVVLIAMILICGDHKVVCVLQISPLVWPHRHGYLLASLLCQGPGRTKNCLVARTLPEQSSDEGSRAEGLQTLLAWHCKNTVASQAERTNCCATNLREGNPNGYGENHCSPCWWLSTGTDQRSCGIASSGDCQTTNGQVPEQSDLCPPLTVAMVRTAYLQDSDSPWCKGGFCGLSA